jgi:hypothetical protein
MCEKSPSCQALKGDGVTGEATQLTLPSLAPRRLQNRLESLEERVEELDMSDPLLQHFLGSAAKPWLNSLMQPPGSNAASAAEPGLLATMHEPAAGAPSSANHEHVTKESSNGVK